MLVGSRISVAVSQQDYQAFHVVQPAPVSIDCFFFHIIYSYLTFYWNPEAKE